MILEQELETSIEQTLVDRVNALKYPPTIYSHGWIYGVWYCGTSFQKAVYYGQYPSTFVKRVTAMFPTDQYRMLHGCCGRCHIAGAVNLDLHNLPEVDVVGNMESTPFEDGSFDVILLDPPYSQQDSDRYKSGRLISSRKVMAESKRLLAPGGWLLWLDEKYPSYRCEDWALKGLVSVVTGFERRVRVMSMWQVRAPNDSHT